MAVLILTPVIMFLVIVYFVVVLIEILDNPYSSARGRLVLALKWPWRLSCYFTRSIINIFISTQKFILDCIEDN